MCCREALYLCSGTMYLCEYHHRSDVWYNPKTKVEDCGGVNCPLGVNHPPASKDPMKSNYPLGCSLCRNTEKLGKDTKPAIQAIEIEETKRTDLANFSEQQQYNPLNAAQAQRIRPNYKGDDEGDEDGYHWDDDRDGHARWGLDNEFRM